MRLAQRQPDGHPLRQHLQAAVDAGARPHPDLLVQPPECAETLVDAFFELHGTRTSTLGGTGPLLPSEIEAWCRLQGLALTPWEADTLMAMDRAASAVPPSVKAQ